MGSEIHVIKVGSTAHGQFETDISIGHAGWEWSSIRVLTLSAGGSETVASGVSRLLVLPLSGGCAVEVNGETHVLNGREEVWSVIIGYLYTPRGTMFMARSESGGRFALPATRIIHDLLVWCCPVTEVATTLRGAGPCSRRVNNYALGNDLETSHLLVYEVSTLNGNWFSYLPHKHNEHSETKHTPEGIYCYEVRPGLNGSPGMALRRIYPSGRDIDVRAEMHLHSVMTMPHGYHDPSVAAPGYDLYYPNVMARPVGDSTWLMTNDPAHTWTRDTWVSQDVDPQLPTTPLN